MIRSVPELLANASGLKCAGPIRCFYCGAACDGSNSAKEYVKSSFTALNTVACPGSPAVCEGCVLAMRSSVTPVMLGGKLRVNATKTMPDGSVREKTPGMQAFSWVLMDGQAFAATKADLEGLRLVCLDPPEPPFAIVLSDSGQTHQLYRGAVNHSREIVVATLEGMPVEFRPDQLRERLVLCGKLVAATGKPALAEPVNVRFAIAVSGYFRGGESLVESWEHVREQPLSRLAAWLCPNKESSQHEYPCEFADEPADPGHGGVAAEARRDGGPAVKPAGVHRKGGDQGRGDPLLFDLE